MKFPALVFRMLVSALLLGRALTGFAQAAPAGPPGLGSSSAAKKPAGIEIVSELTPPARARPFHETDLAGYVMVCFKDETHSAYLAISRDGYTFTDVKAASPSSTARASPSRRACAIRTSPAGPTGLSTSR